jgi:hypothetical protein
VKSACSVVAKIHCLSIHALFCNLGVCTRMWETKLKVLVS